MRACDASDKMPLENNVEKGGNAGNQHFPIPTMFSSIIRQI